MVAPGDSKVVFFEKALLDPGSVFETPEALMAHPDLSDCEKKEILRRWEYDASEACVALEEGMPGPETDLLHRIFIALDQLKGVDVGQSGPTKQHGIPRSAIRPRPKRR
jgi:hypothetical protein